MGLARLWESVVDFCYPGRCAECNDVCDGSWPLCAICDTDLMINFKRPGCELCGMPIAAEKAPCPHCLGDGRPHFEELIRLCLFQDPMKALIHQMKYLNRWGIAEQLAVRMLNQPEIRDRLANIEVIVPVPLHYLRKLKRGYNQAEVIAQVLSKKLKRPWVQAVARVKDTASQTTKTHDERVANMRGAFELVNPKAIEGKAVLVVDDVLTSGSTMASVGNCLSKAHPRFMKGFVFAVADPKGRNFEVL